MLWKPWLCHPGQDFNWYETSPLEIRPSGASLRPSRGSGSGSGSGSDCGSGSGSDSDSDCGSDSGSGSGGSASDEQPSGVFSSWYRTVFGEAIATSPNAALVSEVL